MAFPSTGNFDSGLARVSPAGKFRLVVRASGIILALVAMLPLHGIWRLLRLKSPWPRYFLYATAWCCGVILHIDNRRLKKDVFYVSNHLTWLDIPIVGGATGCTFVSQDGVASWPVIGWLCKLNHTVFVSREDKFAVTEQIETLRAAIDEEQPITIFPEGTTTDGQSLLPFKPSLFAVMVPPPKQMMVQPMLIEYGDSAQDIAWIGEETAPQNAWRLFTRKGVIHARLTFLEPFDPAEFTNRKEISTEARNRIRAALSASLGGKAIL